ADQRRRPLPRRGRLFLPGGGDEQLHMEPAVDVQGSARPRRGAGGEVPRRLAARPRRQPRVPAPPDRAWARQVRVAGDRDRARHAGDLHGQQALVVPRPPVGSRRARRHAARVRRTLLAASLLVLALAPAALSATTPTAPVYDKQGRIVKTPFAPFVEQEQQHLTAEAATAIFLRDHKVHDWLSRYSQQGRTTDATFTSSDGSWTVHVWWGAAGEIARGRVDDASGAVLEAWTGPQVAWSMARGYRGAFGGKELNNPWIWLALSAVFFFGLANLRRPLSMRNLDLLVLLSFGVSLAYFNAGQVFPRPWLPYPPMAYLIGRMVWIGFRGRPVRASAPVWPIWLLAAVTIFLVGFRVGLNTETSNVIDVGYAGVIGAQRIAT